ncbi:SRPBCC family protein [Streptosporangium sp. NBC_01755]|uniref:SRPBCC family protein n=1 Tax=unclassified Streptosporangium TaxID=2632669 RepID=UPI002DDC3CEC|nr:MULTISPECIES: SRPBCC family protein [unclassified Streptosporangium]WSA24807.1 SRPBCC family protein [Streptosporangium sp. NBC_01810]WSC97114.1 SRPBCC family protein [Streptosporangium sp. NBC_01755]
MSPTPTGRLFRTDTGSDLVLSRTFRAPAEDVWASITESDRTALWFGPWEGEAASGRTVKVQMVFEEQMPWCEMRIDACDPPRRLALSMTDESGAWRLELSLLETDGSTELRLVQHLVSEDGIGEIGPGWEYYLDMLVAAREGSPKPDFTDYYPLMKGYFDELSTS